MNVRNRQSFISEIGSFLESTKTALNNILESVGWSVEHLKNNITTNYVTCPNDSGHKMPHNALEKHLEICSGIKRGYTKEELKNALPSSSFFYEGRSAVATVVIDKSLQNYIIQSSLHQGSAALYDHLNEKDVPLTVDHALTELTSEQRLAIYDYVVAEGKKANVNNTFQVEELHMNFERKQEPAKQKSRLEILAEQRDYKRRRQSYRAKNVHITKKSYKEVLREIIENQTQLLNSASSAADNVSEESPISSPARDNLQESTSEPLSHSKGQQDRSRSRERDTRQHSRPHDYTKHRHYREEAEESNSGRPRAHKRKRSRSSERDNGFKRETSKEQSSSRSHHKKSHKKHKKHSHHHHHRRHHSSDSNAI